MVSVVCSRGGGGRICMCIWIENRVYRNCIIVACVVCACTSYNMCV